MKRSSAETNLSHPSTLEGIADSQVEVTPNRGRPMRSSTAIVPEAWWELTCWPPRFRRSRSARIATRSRVARRSSTPFDGVMRTLHSGATGAWVQRVRPVLVRRCFVRRCEPAPCHIAPNTSNTRVGWSGDEPRPARASWSVAAPSCSAPCRGRSTCGTPQLRRCRRIPSCVRRRRCCVARRYCWRRARSLVR
jgi:hypothetical protein